MLYNNKTSVYINVFILLIFLGTLYPLTMTEDPSELQILLRNNEFAFAVYEILSQNKDNLFFSPISIHAVLSMTYQGAEGTTAQHFADVLKIPAPKDSADGYNAIIKRLSSIENVNLFMANKIYAMEGFELLPNFRTAIVEKFLSEIETINFRENEAAAQVINAWVEKKTCDKIKELIQANDLDELTRLVLVNAIYFKGKWKHQFNTNATRIEPFYLNEMEKVDVEMMHIKNKFNYKVHKELEAKVLEMPYVNEDLSMIIVLPNEKNGIDNLERMIVDINLSEITKNLHNLEVQVALPKFKIEQTINLENTLNLLGLGEIFDENKANFRGMIKLKPNENLYVSKVVQKAFIEVNEEGSEAAAATGVVIRMKRSLRKTEEFYVDHPFIYLIVKKSAKHETILFIGRIGKMVATSSESSATHDEL